jgi:multicomponent Na+:H+ antiporter subunit G
MIEFFSSVCIAIGLIFCFWGTWSLLGDRSVLFKLHNLSVSDTLGSISIIVGLLFLRPREWPLLLLAIISLMLWNTMLGYVLASCSSDAVKMKHDALYFNPDFDPNLEPGGDS